MINHRPLELMNWGPEKRTVFSYFNEKLHEKYQIIVEIEL